MKLRKMIAMLFIPVMFLSVSVVASSFSYSNNQNYAQIRADSSSKQAFLDKFKEIRDAQEASGKTICDTTKEEYKVLIELYSALSESERIEVGAIHDEYETKVTIGEMMKEIIRIHYTNNGVQEAPKQKLDQSTTIIIAVVVSIFGMSAISVLYILRNNKYIE